MKHLKNEHRNTKIVKDIQTAIVLSGLVSGMTISFHHHFRNGDFIVNMVMEEIAKMGIRDLVIAASSLIDVHEPLIEHIQNGVVKRIETSGIRGKLGDAISAGLMDIPVVFRSHGDRARAISCGDIKIDVAFLGIPVVDPYGNGNGFSYEQDIQSSCGSLGYAMLDAQFAKKVVVISDHIIEFPNTPFAVSQAWVDYIVKVDSIGDPNGIMSGATRFTTNPREILIANQAANVIENSGYFENGFSMQTGSGGAALATTRFLKEKMLAKKITARFALGGITAPMVELHEQGLIDRLLDVQSFDMVAAESLKKNRFHQQIDSSFYANLLHEGCAVNQLDIVVLSALEIDSEFNVNVLTGSDGVIRGAIGGHPDTAAGSKICIVVAPLVRGRMPMILDRVNTVVTPGRTVDVFVTDQGMAVNPRRPDLQKRLTDAKLAVFTMEELKRKAEAYVGHPKELVYEEKTVGLVTYRDGTTLDVVKQIKTARQTT